MFIYIVRHAWAYEHGDPRWPDDSRRPLEAEGAARFSQVVERLASRGFAPGHIATSPYVRCRQTAEIIAAHVPHGPQIASLDALRPGSDFDAVADWCRGFAGESTCWVGHAPDVGLLTAALIGQKPASIRFAKGAVAAVSVHSPVGLACGELHWLATAKLLGA